MNSVHPIIDLEKGIEVLPMINRQIVEKKNYYDLDDEKCEYGDGWRSSSSKVSLSAELVEAIMHDGQIRLTSEKAHETAMWCGMFSFLILGIGMIGIGLFMMFNT